ncbi:ficolin-2-like [Drosophila innubila]|uniref:ficolin-2-like n=1 Tax=Drosophila innubila TaxID=198719 RepID=UPI00148D33F5|nr:ficolin-2-like [Drosophila innubila]
MNINLKILPIFLIFIHYCYAYNVECLNKKADDSQCSKYCYEVVKPLLQYAKEANQKAKTFGELMDEINELRTTQAKLETTVDGQIEQLEVYKKKDAEQSQLVSKYKTELDNLIAQNTKTSRLLSETKKKSMRDQLEYKNNMKKSNEVDSNISSCLVKKTGIQQIIVHDIRNFPVSCDSDLVDSGWTVIQRRKDASVSFERGWNDYRRGFGDLEGSFFIGLEKLYLLTNEQPHELYIHLKSFENETRFARYDHFQIGDESESYKLKSLGKYSGNAGNDSLIYHLDMKFSTFDQDNDNSTINCAAEWLSGWWYNSCAHSNLNGVYKDDKINYYNGIKWNSWDTVNHFTFVQMMIRPISP